MLTLRSDAAYDLLSPSSMGVRLTPKGRQSVHMSTDYTMQATSAETNVLTVPAALGMQTKVLTTFVADSPIAAFIKANLRQRNIAYEGPELPQGGPWGYRHQFNIADSGFGLRAPCVTNDRAGEVGLTLSAKDFDLARLFQKEGCKILHISGLIAALSPSTGQFCLELARAAKHSGARISFDLNYRASFWKGRRSELFTLFSKIAALSDILLGNEEDFQLALAIEGPEAGGEGLAGKMEVFKGMIASARAAYPHVSVFATTLREVVSANEHLWGAILFAENNWYAANPRSIPILDRIGGGDAFVSGLLYGILRGWSYEDCLHFGWATGALVTTTTDDYATPLDEAQVWDIWRGNARVKR